MRSTILEKFFIPYFVPGICLGVGFVLTTMVTGEARHQYYAWKWTKIIQQEQEQRDKILATDHKSD